MTDEVLVANASAIICLVSLESGILQLFVVLFLSLVFFCVPAKAGATNGAISLMGSGGAPGLEGWLTSGGKEALKSLMPSSRNRIAPPASQIAEPGCSTTCSTV